MTNGELEFPPIYSCSIAIIIIMFVKFTKLLKLMHQFYDSAVIY